MISRGVIRLPRNRENIRLQRTLNHHEARIDTDGRVIRQVVQQDLRILLTEVMFEYGYHASTETLVFNSSSASSTATHLGVTTLKGACTHQCRHFVSSGNGWVDSERNFCIPLSR